MSLSFLFARAWPRTILCCALAALVSACSGSRQGNTITGSVGVISGVTLSTNGLGTSVLPNGTLAITASVLNDTTNAGVTWSVSPNGGTLSAQTTTGVTYNAPATVQGTLTPLITATSIANPSNVGIVPLTVLGTPILPSSITLFPAYVNIPYTARIVVDGGLAPFTWIMDAASPSATPPPGLAFAASTSSQESIAGVPTTVGVTTMLVDLTDSETPAQTQKVSLTLTVNPQLGCLMGLPPVAPATVGTAEHFVFLNTGYVDRAPYTRVMSLTFDTTINFTGIEDMHYSSVGAFAESAPGTCSVTGANAGVIALVPASGGANYTYAAAVNALGVIDHGRVQQNGTISASSSGQFLLQDSTAFALSTLAGDFAFGLTGGDTDGTRLGFIGHLTMDGAGHVLGGNLDANGSVTALSHVAVSTGTAMAADANGRGTLQLSAGAKVYNFAYYIVSANQLVLIAIDAAGPVISGFMTRQSTPGSFASTSLAPATTPALLSLWGASGSSPPITAVAMGLLSGANAGVVGLNLDTSDHGSATPAVNFPAATYTVASDGSGTLQFGTGTAARNLVFFLDGVSSGYVIEKGSINHNNGVIEAQTVPIGGFPTAYPGQFLEQTQYPAAAGPISLLPQVIFPNGTLSAAIASGYFYMDNTTGRGLGTISESGVATEPFAIYILDPSRIRVLRFGATTLNGTIDWINL